MCQRPVTIRTLSASFARGIDQRLRPMCDSKRASVDEILNHTIQELRVMFVLTHRSKMESSRRRPTREEADRLRSEHAVIECALCRRSKPCCRS